MNLVFHVFRKDVRHLYPEILLLLLMTAAFAWAAPAQWGAGMGVEIFAGGAGIPTMLTLLLRVLLPIMWLVLISRLVQDESLVGDRQFWITRPYTWPGLLAAKVLFVLVFLVTPFVIMQVWLLHHAGFDVRSAAGDLMRYNIGLSAIFFLSFMVLAAVTSTFARAALSVLGAVLYVLGIGVVYSYLSILLLVPHSLLQLCEVLPCAVGIAVLVLQYARRRTALSRLVLIGLPVVIVLIALYGPKKMLIDRAYPPLAASLRPTLVFDPEPLHQPAGSGPPMRVGSRMGYFFILKIPMTQSGLADGLSLDIKGISVEVQTADGYRWNSPFYRFSGEVLTSENPNPVFEVLLPVEVFNRIRDKEANLHVEVAAEAYQSETPQTVAAASPTFRAPGGGICKLDEGSLTTNCRYAMKLPDTIRVSAPTLDHLCIQKSLPQSGSSGVQDSPATATLGADGGGVAMDFDPVVIAPLTFSRPKWHQGEGSAREYAFDSEYLCPGMPVTFTSTRFVQRGQFSFDIANVVLGPYATREQKGQVTNFDSKDK